MTDFWLKRWNDRYSEEDYAFGVEPNTFFKAHIENLKPGKILLGAEGEGRNAVYAARLGWEVSAFDISSEGRKKAFKLAEINHVSLAYQVGELPSLNYHNNQFDALALIYAHFPFSIRPKYHKLLGSYVRQGGILILEAFDKNHLEYKLKNPKVGGPNDLEGLFSIEEIKSDFEDFEILEFEEKEIELREGAYHDGIGHVVRVIGKKR